MSANILLPRQYGGYGDNCYRNAYGQVNCYNSAWNSWVRWLVLGLVILAAFLIFFLFSCITARRRRKQGYAPYRGTGWTVRHGTPTYNNNAQPGLEQQTQQPYYNNSNNPPPAYHNGANAGYYGNDTELQQPKPAYNGGYAPPAGAPPNRY